MLSRRPATWFRLLPLILVIPGCDGGQTSVSPTPTPSAPVNAAAILTCVIGTADCASVMQGQTLTFTANPGIGTGSRSALLVFGDGTPSVDLGSLPSAATITHEYQRLGTFVARLDVTTSTDTKSASLTIAVGSFVSASISATNLGDLNVNATADVQGATVAQYEWLFEPGTPTVVTYGPNVVFTYTTPGYKAIDLRVVLTDGRVVRASGHVIVGRENEA